MTHVTISEHLNIQNDQHSHLTRNKTTILMVIFWVSQSQLVALIAGSPSLKQC